MKEIWQWIINWKGQVAEWCREQFTWWDRQTYWVKICTFCIGVSICVLTLVAIIFAGYSLFHEDSGRGRNLILLVAGIIGWYFLYRRTATAEQHTEAAEQSAEATRQSAATAEKGLTTGRLTQAVDQLAHKKPFMRLGGILGLEQIADAHEEECYKIARVLVSFIRTRALKNSEETEKDIDISGISRLEPGEDFAAYREQRLDIEAAIHALTNIVSNLEKQGEIEKQGSVLCDLKNTDLRGLQLNNIDLSHFNLKGTDFSWAHLSNADFTHATISFFIIPIINQKDITKFFRTHLSYANFSNTYLYDVDFSHSYLSGVIFDNAHLNNAIFDKCDIAGTHFENSESLTPEQIIKAHFSAIEKPPILPEGFDLQMDEPILENGLPVNQTAKQLLKKDFSTPEVTNTYLLLLMMEIAQEKKGEDDLIYLLNRDVKGEKPTKQMELMMSDGAPSTEGMSPDEAKQALRNSVVKNLTSLA